MRATANNKKKLQSLGVHFEKEIIFENFTRPHHEFLFNFLPPSSTVPKIFVTMCKPKRVVFNYVRAKLEIFWDFVVAELASLGALPYRWRAII